MLALYSPKDVILSIVALSRLQNIVSDQQIGKNNTGCGSGLVDELTLNDLAHYAKFAHAAYGWKVSTSYASSLVVLMVGKFVLANTPTVSETGLNL